MSTLQLSSEEVAEIEKHKYFLSEKAGFDVGWEAAEQDWLANHADQFRGQHTADEDGDDSASIVIYLRRLLKRPGRH